MPRDEDLLAAHFDDLKKTEETDLVEETNMARKPTDDDEEIENEEDEEEEEEEEVADTAPPPAAPATTPAPAVTLGAPPPNTAEPRRRAHRRTKHGGDRSGITMGAAPATDWPMEAELVWDRILAELPAVGKTPRDIYIKVERYGIGGFQSEPVQMGNIEGDSVSGSEAVAPGQALYDYVVDLFHARAPGPSKYVLTFQWKRGGTIKRGELRLASPHEIAQQRADAAARQMAQGLSPTMGAIPRPAPYYPPPQYGAPYQPPVGMGAQPPYYPPPQDNGTAQSVHEMRREMAGLMGRLDEIRQREAAATGQPPPPPMAPPVSAETEDARVARTVVGVLQAMGITPGARVGMAGPPAQQQAAPVGFGSQGSQGFGSIIDRAREQVTGLKALASIFKEVDSIKETMGMGQEPPDDEVVQAPNPIVEDANTPAFAVRKIPFTNFLGKEMNWVARDDEESLTEWLPKMAAANPEASMKFLELGLRVIDQGAIGGLLRAFSQQGGAPAAAAAQVQSNGMAGIPVRPGHSPDDIPSP